MAIINALLHHVFIIQFKKINNQIYWRVSRACSKARSGYRCGGKRHEHIK